MKKLTKLSLIVLIPLITGIALIVIGSSSGNENILRIGEAVLAFGMPITMVVLVVVGLVLMITGRLADKDKSDDEQPVTREQEMSDIRDVNASRGYESHRKSDKFMMRHVSNNYKHATPKEKVLGWLFFGFLMTDFVLILVFAMLHVMVGALVCFCIFGGTILVSLIVKIIIERMSMRVKPAKLDDKETLKGVVTACLLSSTTSVGGSERRYTTHITGVVYRVVIDCDGQQYTAYSKEYYEEGDEVFFVVRHRTIVAIVDPDKIRKSDDTKF